MSRSINALILIHLQSRPGEWVPIGQICPVLRMSSEGLRPYLQNLAASGQISSATVADVNGREHECYGKKVDAGSPVHGIGPDAPRSQPTEPIAPQRRADDEIDTQPLHSIDL